MGYAMSAIFLSASIPILGRGDYYRTADPFLIQTAVREFITLSLGRRLIVWGGHPAITPMVWSVCEDLGVNYANAVVLYQSNYFRGMFPDENERFGNVVYVDAVDGDLQASLLKMRGEMFARNDLDAAVFIGGMEGILVEHSMFLQSHPDSKVLPIPSPGGAARELALNLGMSNEAQLQDVDFARFFYEELRILPTESRTQFDTRRSNGETGVL
jgi:hypothetical protein